MARAQFDRNDVVEDSITLFWQQGFNGSSMQEVTKVTGLKPGSLYLAFGSKEGLYKEALQQYSDNSMQQIRDVLDRAPSVGVGICELLKEIVLASNQNDYCSCFVIKTQLELAAEGGELYEFALKRLSDTEALFCNYLEQEFSAEQSADRATSLMLHMFGVRVYGYQNPSAERMNAALQEGLSWLPWES